VLDKGDFGGWFGDMVGCVWLRFRGECYSSVYRCPAIILMHRRVFFPFNKRALLSLPLPRQSVWQLEQ
jgi:hypothetical protein